MSRGRVSRGHGDVFSIRCPSAVSREAARSPGSSAVPQPVLHLQESPVCHLGIQGTFFHSETEKRSQGALFQKHFSLKEWSGTGFPLSGSVQEGSGCDFVVRMVVVLGWPLDLLISSSLVDSVGFMELAQVAVQASWYCCLCRARTAQVNLS